MKRFLIVLLSTLPVLALAEDYQSTLLVQTGQMRESDLVVRTISDLESNKICLAFYVRTVGTSPVLNCFDAVSGFRSRVKQSAHFKEGKLVSTAHGNRYRIAIRGRSVTEVAVRVFSPTPGTTGRGKPTGEEGTRCDDIEGEFLRD